MRAAVCREYGPPETLTIEDREIGGPGAGEILVEVHAAAVNFPDVLFMQDRYQVSIPPPFVPGSELAGRVSAIGSDVSGVAIGDLVMGALFAGAFAEQVLLPAASATILPPDTDPHAAAAFGVAYTTAHGALCSAGEVRQGETVLILGAAGGVGLASVDVARSLGARVIAAVSGADKAEACRAYGADLVIDAGDDLKSEVKAATGGRGVDVVIDPVGGPLSEAALRATGWGGRFVCVGFASGEIPRIPLNLPLLKGSQIRAFNMGPFAQNEPDASAASRAAVQQMFFEGRVRPRISAVYPLERAADALLDVSERRAIGKVIIDPRLPAGAPTV